MAGAVRVVVVSPRSPPIGLGVQPFNAGHLGLAYGRAGATTSGSGAFVVEVPSAASTTYTVRPTAGTTTDVYLDKLR